MSDPFETPSVASADAALARTGARARVAVGVQLVILAVATGAMVAHGPLLEVEIVAAACVLGIAVALLFGSRAGSTLAARRLGRDAGFARILHGLSRSLSPESVVDAIVEELRSASGADHVIIARVRRADEVVEVTLVSGSAAAGRSRTSLRPDVLGEPHRAGRPAGGPVAPGEAAEELARRVRAAYGLPYTLAEPLVADGQFAGALILSRRTRGAWTEMDRPLLVWAAGEVSAAFARAYAHEEAETRANIDALTGLPNRRYFDELIAVVGPRRRVEDTLGVLMIDIDHFKRLNDRYGHPTGDTVLRAVADAIAATVRGDDTPARYGGEEFAVVLRTADAAQAADVAERVRLAVRQLPVETLGVAEPVTVSVGVAVGSGDVTALVRRADAALYAAKRRGRDRVVAAPGIAPRGPGDPATDADDPSMPDQRRSAAPEQPPVSDAPGGVP